MDVKQLKPTQQLIDHCNSEGIDPACLGHMLFEGPYGPTVMHAHLIEALGKISFPEKCPVCEENRQKWLKPKS